MNLRATVSLDLAVDMVRWASLVYSDSTQTLYEVLTELEICKLIYLSG